MFSEKLIQPGLPRGGVGSLPAPVLNVARPVALATPGLERGFVLLGMTGSRHREEGGCQCNRGDKADSKAISPFGSHSAPPLSG